MSPRLIAAVSILGFCAVLAGCARPYASAAYDSSPPPPPGREIEFPGVVHELQRERPLDVLLVHGMCTHDRRWAHAAVANLYRDVGGGPDTVAPQMTVVPDTDIQLFQQTLSTRHGPMRVNAIVWSPMTTPLKKKLCFDQVVKLKPAENDNAYCLSPEETRPYPYHRDASLNRTLKDEILDDCLADAMVYQGRSRDEMTARMLKAVLQALGSSGGQQPVARDARALIVALEVAPESLVIITDSLGSKIAFDAIWLGTQQASTRAAVQRTLDRTTQIFMRANQMPILALADDEIERKVAPARARAEGATADEVRYPRDSLGALLGGPAGAARAMAGKPLPAVVSFTDPNDLLSFILVPSPHRREYGYPVVDVVTSNADTYFGFLEHPLPAHTAYDKNATVRERIACGRPKSKLCGA